MTEKEAIYILRNAAWLGSNEERQKVEEAVEVVAKAIEAQGRFGKDTNVPSNNILRHPSCKNRTSLGNCDPVGGFCSSVPKDICAKYYVSNTNVRDMISRQAAINAIRASTSKYMGFMEMEMYTDDDAVEAIEDLPSIQLSRIERELHGKTPEEQYKILYQLMFEYANTFNDARRAVIDWLGE